VAISLRRLRAFVMVAEKRSVTLAARDMNMTAPAVTKSVRELETALAVELFKRTSSGMLLTPAGETFLVHAERALSEIERGREEVTLLMGGAGGKIAIGATVEAAILVLPLALGRLIERRKQIEVSLRGGSFESLCHDVRSGALDFFLGVAPEDGIIGNLIAKPLYADELKLVVRPGHPLVSVPHLTLKDLTAYRWVRSTSHGPLLAAMRRKLEEVGEVFPDNTVLVEPLSSMRGLLRNTDLVAAVAGTHMREETDMGQLVALPVSLPASHRIVSIVKRDETYQSAWAKELIALLHQTVRELNLVTDQHH
jgi:LysR family transcriptional regulator of gallate degradation